MSRRIPHAPSARTVLALCTLSALALAALPGGAFAGDEKKTEGTEKMEQAAMKAGETAKDWVSGAAELGKPAPDFTLTDTDGKAVKLGDYKGKIVVLEWFNPDCPFVKKHHINHKSMADAYGAIKADDVVWLAVNSGAPGKQGAGLERNQVARKEYAIAYPILLDETGVVGQAYGAKNTPHMFVVDQAGKLAYVGAIDDNPSPDVLGQLNYVVDTVTRLKKGESLVTSQTKPYGCGVKYAS